MTTLVPPPFGVQAPKPAERPIPEVTSQQGAAAAAGAGAGLGAASASAGAAGAVAELPERLAGGACGKGVEAFCPTPVDELLLGGTFDPPPAAAGLLDERESFPLVPVGGQVLSQPVGQGERGVFLPELVQEPSPDLDGGCGIAGVVAICTGDRDAGPLGVFMDATRTAELTP